MWLESLRVTILRGCLGSVLPLAWTLEIFQFSGGCFRFSAFQWSLHFSALETPLTQQPVAGLSMQSWELRPLSLPPLPAMDKVKRLPALQKIFYCPGFEVTASSQGTASLCWKMKCAYQQSLMGCCFFTRLFKKVLTDMSWLQGWAQSWSRAAFRNASTPPQQRRQKPLARWEGEGGKAPSCPGAELLNSTQLYLWHLICLYIYIYKPQRSTHIKSIVYKNYIYTPKSLDFKLLFLLIHLLKMKSTTFCIPYQEKY